MDQIENIGRFNNLLKEDQLRQVLVLMIMVFGEILILFCGLWFKNII